MLPTAKYDGSILPEASECALSLGATLVTNNLREFERVPDLEAEDWTKPERGSPDR